MGYHSDPTANQAISSVNREWNRTAKLAIKIRESNDYEAELESRRFTGIFKRLLTDPLEKLHL